MNYNATTMFFAVQMSRVQSETPIDCPCMILAVQG